MDLNYVGSQDKGKPKPKFTKLTEAERERILREGGCLYCRAKDHTLDNCPKKRGRVQGNELRPGKVSK
jgi:hypothetical protein